MDRNGQTANPLNSPDPEVMRLAAQVLRDPAAMEKLCDRIYQLMEQDLQRQQERDRTYRRRQ